MLKPLRITAPANPLMTLSEAKLHLRVSNTDEDTLISALITAATDYLDGYAGILGRCLINQTWSLLLDSWPSSYIQLPFPDASTVTVQYYDAADALQTLAASNYRLVEGSNGSIIDFKSTFSAPSLSDRMDAIQISMVAGYGVTAANVPGAIIQAAKLLIGAWYENREETVIGVTIDSLPNAVAVKSLLKPYMRTGA